MCILLCMRRIQLHIDEELDEGLAAQARKRGMSKAALIREYLRQHVRPDQAEDPSTRLIGAYEGTPDESASIDDVVYG